MGAGYHLVGFFFSRSHLDLDIWTHHQTQGFQDPPKTELTNRLSLRGRRTRWGGESQGDALSAVDRWVAEDGHGDVYEEPFIWL